MRWLTLPAGRRGKWVVLAAWLLVFGTFGWLAGFIGQVRDNDETNWMPADAQSTRAVRLAERAFPAADTAPLAIVYARPGGLTPADRAAAQRDRDELSSLADGPVTGPDASPDGAASLVTVPVASAKLDSGDVDGVVADARRIVHSGLPAGLVARATGAAAARADSAAANKRVNGTLTLVTVGVVLVLLLVTYRSPILPFLPLLCVVCGVVVAQGGTYLLGRAGAVVSGTSSILMIVLVFGLGTDYALLLTARYGEELTRYADRHGAMAVALRRTVPSLCASAATMVLASLTLLAADMNSTKGLGPVAAVAVAAALLAMTTLYPALLVALGRWVFWPRRFSPTTVRRRRLRHPRRTWVRTALALAAVASGAGLLHVGGLNGADNFTRKPESVLGQQLVAAHFAAGTTAPALVYVPAGTVVHKVPGVSEVDSPEVAGRWARVRVVLADPPTTAAAQRTVKRLREALPGAVVGGQTATIVDQNAAMDRDLAVLAPLIVLVVGLVLAVLLRAVVATLLLLGCALLSAGAALGGSTLLFRVLGFPRTDQSVLTLGFLFLVALGVDYTIFLMARAREEAIRVGHAAGVRHALAATAGVITSAGVVLAATFLVLTVTPVVVNIQLGLLVCGGVLIDAFVVRTILVPALALDVGPATWWPVRLTGSADPTGRRTPPAEPGPGRAA